MSVSSAMIFRQTMEAVGNDGQDEYFKWLWSHRKEMEDILFHHFEQNPPSAKRHNEILFTIMQSQQTVQQEQQVVPLPLPRQQEAYKRLDLFPTVILGLISSFLSQTTYVLWLGLCRSTYLASTNPHLLLDWSFGNLSSLFKIRIAASCFYNARSIHICSKINKWYNREWRQRFIYYLDQTKTQRQQPNLYIAQITEDPDFPQDIQYNLRRYVKGFSWMHNNFLAWDFVQTVAQNLHAASVFIGWEKQDDFHWSLSMFLNRMRDLQLPNLRELTLCRYPKAMFSASARTCVLQQFLEKSPNLTHLRLNCGFFYCTLGDALKKSGKLKYIEFTHHVPSHGGLGLEGLSAIYVSIQVALESLVNVLQEFANNKTQLLRPLEIVVKENINKMCNYQYFIKLICDLLRILNHFPNISFQYGNKKYFDMGKEVGLVECADNGMVRKITPVYQDGTFDFESSEGNITETERRKIWTRAEQLHQYRWKMVPHMEEKGSPLM